MSKNFNNNTNNNDNSINLQIASLNSNLLTNYPTNTAISTLLASTVQSQTTLRDSAISASLASANLFTSNSLLNYSSTILTNTAISNAINLNNTSNIAYTNSKIVTEVVDRNTAITNNNTANLALAKTYTAAQTFSDILLSGTIKYQSIVNSIALGFNSASSLNNSCAYGSNSQAGMNNCVALGDTSVCGSYFCTAIGQNSFSSGQGTTSLGCNAGKLGAGVQTSVMNFCTYIGANTGCDAAANYVYASAIGAGAQITASNTVQVGRINDTLNTSNIIATNITTTNLTSTIHNVNQQIITYSTIPIFSSQRYIGFMNSALSLKNVTAFNVYTNLCQISVIPGVYLIQFQMNYNYSASNLVSWLNFGIGTTSSNFDIQACKSYCSSSPSIPFNISNSYMYSANASMIIYLNAFLNDFDNTTLTVANLSNISIASKLTICRIA